MNYEANFLLPEEIINVIEKLEADGFCAYVAGGAVRDMLMGKIPSDYDIATNALPEQVKACFENNTGTAVAETGRKYGTVTVLLGRMAVEVTTFRSDGIYSDGRRPDSVTFSSSIEEDLKRRDFTINAMAYRPSNGFIDLFGGQADLNKRLIRAVGVPEERFFEDGLRILRMFRFSAALDFEIEPDTLKGANKAASCLKFISDERISKEFSGILISDSPGKTIALMAGQGFLRYIVPEFGITVGFDQRSKYHNLTVDKHIELAVDNVAPSIILRLAAFFHDIGKPLVFSLDAKGEGHFYGHEKLSAEIAQKRLRSLKYDAKTIKDVAALIQWHDMPVALTEKAVKRQLNALGVEMFRQLIELKKADASAHTPAAAAKTTEKVLELEKLMEQILEKQSCFSLKDLAVDGNDIKALGVPEGREIGELLKKLLNLVMDSKLENNKNTLIDYVKGGGGGQSLNKFKQEEF